jgi:hypothetical protein
MVFLLAHAVHQATTLRAWIRNSVYKMILCIAVSVTLKETGRQFGIKIVIKSPDASYINYWITWL